MSKIPKCHLETYWANKDVFTCPKSQNVIWKPTGASKEVFTCPKFQNVIWKPTGLTKRFLLHVENPKMPFGNLLG